MTKYAALAVLLIALLPALASAQAPASIAGFVRDSAGAAVPAAVVSVRAPDASEPSVSVATDDAGRFMIPRIAPGTWHVDAGRIGFADSSLVVTLRAGERRVLSFVLRELPVLLESITVEADRARQSFEEDAGLTARIITAEQLRSLPGLAEPDVLRAIEVLPGVVSTSDFSSAFNVRGGSADQNLILLDGIPIYNPFHLGGLFSVFNADMISRAELLAGGFPAEYGGRVSSVLTVESDAGRDGFDFDAGVSLLASRVALGDDVPGALDAIGVADGRWRVAARRSYFDVLLQPFFDFPYHLTDVQGYADLRLANDDRLTITAYSGTDLLDLSQLEDDGFPLRIRWDWGNDLVGAGWQRALAGGVRLGANLSHTRFDTGLRFPDFEDTDFRSEITQTSLRFDAHVDRSRGFGGAAGFSLDRMAYDNLAMTGGTVFRGEDGDGWLPALYGQLEWRDRRWIVEAGARAEHWSVRGERDYTYVSPRFAVKRFLDDDMAAKLALGRYTQYVHSVRNEELPFGLDIWVTAGDRAPAVVSDQVQLGLERYFANDDWFASIETYARRFDGLIAFNVADDTNDPRDDFLFGHGSSYGVDMLLRRDRGLGPHGWVSASWLRASRTLPDPTAQDEADGRPPELRYPPVWDRRVDVDVVMSQELGDGWELGARFNFGSGLPHTRAIGSYAYLDYDFGLGGGVRPPSEDDDEVDEGEEDEPFVGVLLGPRNAERYPAYHRLDLSVRRRFERDWGTLTAYAQVINAYNQKNVLFWFYQMDRDPPTRTGISMLPVLPTLGVEVSF
ncbi:MAG TPA: TonB-dependent receptor [Longimicrobiales bacterium]